MGVVFKARDPLIGRLIALKTITASVADDPGLLERFRGEAKAAGALQHPNIVTIYEMGEADGVPFIAMEYLEGESLDALISRRAPVPLAQKIGYLVQTCRALQYAHRRGVIHRDIKPANIVAMLEGEVKVVDFGIARLIDSSKTQTGTFLGTLAYMSPQQIRGERADARSDIWSLGVVLYEFLTGRRPFYGENHAALLLSILQNDPVPLQEAFAECPRQLDAISRRALAKNDAERYQSMEEMLLELKSAWASIHLSKSGKAPAEAADTAEPEYALQPARGPARTQIAQPTQKIAPRSLPARKAPSNAMPVAPKPAPIPSVPIPAKAPAPKPSSPVPANLVLATPAKARSWQRGIAFAAVGLTVLAGIGWEARRVRLHSPVKTPPPVPFNAPAPSSKAPEPAKPAASEIEGQPSSPENLTPDQQFNAAQAHFNQAVAAKDVTSLKLRVRPEFQQIAQGGGPRGKDAAGYLSSAIPLAVRRFTPWPAIKCVDAPDRVNDDDVQSGAFVACNVLDPPNLQWVQFSWPEFPAQASQTGLDNGVAMLSLNLDRRGVVIGAWSRVKRDSYGFVDSALHAALKWKTTVPREAGRPVETQISVDVLFSQ
jgi:serine/threonine protein kinase